VMNKRLHLMGSTLRGRSAQEKAQLVQGLLARFGPALEAGRLRPVVDRRLPLARAQEAHDVVERSEHFGKVVLEVR
jgi:NADPH:quinone reductase-like Zn-dependent oxidoreductase